MFTKRYERLFFFAMAPFVCFFVAGIYFASVLKVVLSTSFFLAGAVAFFVAGVMFGREIGRDDNLGKLVKENDLVPGRYLFGKKPNGQIVVSKHVYAARCLSYAPAVRLFDATASDIPVRYFSELPIGGSLLMEKTSDNEWIFVQGVAA